MQKNHNVFCGGKRMWNRKGAGPIAASLAVIAAVTAILWYVKVEVAGPHHLVFFYLLPITLVAILYGSLPATLCALVALACAAFLLYDPVYSFYVSNPLEFGDLVCFALLALIAVKCTGELLRPLEKAPAAKPHDVAERRSRAPYLRTAVGDSGRTSFARVPD